MKLSMSRYFKFALITVCLLSVNEVSGKTKTYEDLENMKQEASKHIDRQVAGTKQPAVSESASMKSSKPQASVNEVPEQ
jgi:hypothetical protein